MSDDTSWRPVAPTSFAVAQACQVTIGVVVSARGRVDVPALVAPFQGIPAAHAFGDSRDASRLLQEFTIRAGFELHRQRFPECKKCSFDPTTCKPANPTINSQAINWSAAEIAEAWAHWLERELITRHPPDIVTRVRHAFELAGNEPPRVSEIAGDLCLSSRALQRLFMRATGVSIRRYRIGLRLAEAFDRLRDSPWKIEAVAQSVGWHSKKDLYVAFNRFLGRTPGAIRRLSASDAAAVRELLRVRYLCRPMGSGDSEPMTSGRRSS